jgi:DNA repair exonuclease SbcCD ATPase subunit
MDLKKQILVALGIEDNEVKLEYQAKLTDGTIIVSEADELAAGVSVMVLAEDGTTMPLPVGEYETEEGTSFSVEEEGIVAEIMEEEVEAEEDEEDYKEEKEEMEEATEEVEETEEVEFDKEGLITEIGSVIKELLEEVKTDIARLDAELNEMKGLNEELETEKAELSKEVEKLSKEPATAPVKTSKFNEVKKETLSKDEYRKMTKKEKYWYNIRNK